jgi:DNA-binding HxlR family transcriptional regulator
LLPQERTTVFAAIIRDRCRGPAAWEDSEMRAQQSEDCRAFVQMLDRISNKWTVMVVDALQNGPVRFNALMRDVDGVSHRMLTLTLRALETDGLVVRTAYATIPPRVEYDLTALGCSLIEPLAAMAAWVRQNRPAIEAARNKAAMAIV